MVFSHTLKDTGWDSAKLLDKPLEEAVLALRQVKIFSLAAGILILQLMKLNVAMSYSFVFIPS